MTIASIDIGTNTILLLIAEIDTQLHELKVLENLQSIPRIGKGMIVNNPMPAENIERMMDVLTEYEKKIKKYNCEKILLTGTNALRIASNKSEIIAEVKNKFGYDLNIIPGNEEAQYSFIGAISGFRDNSKNLVIDIGGGSTEIIFGKGKEILFSKSFHIGVVSGTEKFFLSDPPSVKQIQNFIDYTRKIFSDLLEKDIDRTIAIAGTPTTLAAIKHKLKSYDEELIEGSSLTFEELNTFVAELSKLSYAEILDKYYQIVKGREDILLAGTIILRELLKLLNIEEVKVSTKGIRYGAIIKWLNLNYNSQS
ncbi:MAG: Ppx/GppA family phosphatase [Ignavibacteriales bacterium]|nr:MAG: Ppx/GppA family phosphatase [Ignavibacteriales bacterium]